jgi:hypothetical protein
MEMLEEKLLRRRYKVISWRLHYLSTGCRCSRQGPWCYLDISAATILSQNLSDTGSCENGRLSIIEDGHMIPSRSQSPTASRWHCHGSQMEQLLARPKIPSMIRSGYLLPNKSIVE